MPTHHHDRLDFDVRLTAGELHFIKHCPGVHWICGINEYGHTPDGRKHVAKQFDTFSIGLRSHQRDTGNVSSRLRQAWNDASFDGVTCQDHDWNVLCCLFGCQCARYVKRYDYIDSKAHQLGGEVGKSIQLSVGRPKLECNVSPFHVTKFAQSFPKLPLERISVRDPYIKRTYPRNLRLLRHDWERRSQRYAGQTDKEGTPRRAT